MRGDRTLLLPWVGLVLLACLPYALSLWAPLLYDDRTLLDNAWLAREAGIGTVFSHDYWFGTRHAGSDLYRPLTILSLAWNLRLAGSRFGFRLVNVLLHALVCCEVALVLLRCLSPRQRRLSFAPWLGAALFAVHPLASEAVLWVVGRAEILSAALGLGAFLLLVRAPESGVFAAGGACLLLFLALLAKESAASWIPLGALWLALAGAGRRRTWTWLLASTATLAAFLLLRGSVVGWHIAGAERLDNPLASVSGPTRVANAVLLQGRYLGKMLVPFPQSIDYGYDQIRVLGLVPWGALAAASLLCAWLVVLSRSLRSPGLAFLWSFVPLAFAITGNFLFPIGTIFAERLAYLPLVGAAGVSAALLLRLPSARVRSALAGLLLALLAWRTLVRGRDYRSLEALTEATARASPRSVKALLNLGRTRLELLNRPAEAIAPLERAVSLAPDEPRLLRLLGEAHRRLGHAAQADAYARRAALEEQR